MPDNIWIFDFEVFHSDWLVVFKSVKTGEYKVIWNDPYQVQWFMNSEPILCGFNNKHYDNFILKAVLLEATPEEVKGVNDEIIIGGVNGWNINWLNQYKIYFDSFDLMDDMQQGLSLKAIEAHLGMDIEESEVDFKIDRPLTDEERAKTEFYCKYDVDATEKLFHLRKDYLENKIVLGNTRGLTEAQSLYMTNAKLTSVYLKADRSKVIYNDARNYQYPENLKREYIPQEVFDFFNRMGDENLTDDEVFSGQINITVGDCPVTIGYGGIHGAIPNYVEESTENRTIRNKDVASYYPNIMRVMGYCSRTMENPQLYADTIAKRVEAKKTGDKATANALKLVLNTTYGAMLNGKGSEAFNDLYDPLMGRSVCITGQLFLLELSKHLIEECLTLKVIQLNTDGIMVSFDNSDESKWQEITQEWQDRTGFELEEDFIKKIVQKDVNNYVEVPVDGGEPKVKGVQLVRGIAKAGAFNVNNNASIVSKAINEYFVNNTSVEDTVNNCSDILEFQLIAKASSKYKEVYQVTDKGNVPVQRCNRVYATKNRHLGTLYKVHAITGGDAKIAGLPAHCVIDNKNHLIVNDIDKNWYIKLAKKYINDFLGIEPPKKNTRKINQLVKKSLALLESED